VRFDICSSDGTLRDVTISGLNQNDQNVTTPVFPHSGGIQYQECNGPDGYWWWKVGSEITISYRRDNGPVTSEKYRVVGPDGDARKYWVG
jgi:hypothetical protein